MTNAIKPRLVTPIAGREGIFRLAFPLFHEDATRELMEGLWAGKNADLSKICGLGAKDLKLDAYDMEYNFLDTQLVPGFVTPKDFYGIMTNQLLNKARQFASEKKKPYFGVDLWPEKKDSGPMRITPVVSLFYDSIEAVVADSERETKTAVARALLSNPIKARALAQARVGYAR